MAKKKQLVTTDASGLTSNPFAQLADLGGAAASVGAPDGEGTGADAAPTDADSDASEGASPPGVRRAVVRYQRKGRGGKEVTALELRGLTPADLGAWLTKLKKRLGCGGFLEGELIVLAGDQRQRLREILEGAGVAKISVS